MPASCDCQVEVLAPMEYQILRCPVHMAPQPGLYYANRPASPLPPPSVQGGDGISVERIAERLESHFDPSYPDAMRFMDEDYLMGLAIHLRSLFQEAYDEGYKLGAGHAVLDESHGTLGG